MYAAIYLDSIRFTLEMNERPFTWGSAAPIGKVVDAGASTLPFDGYANPETGMQDSNIDLNDDDMSRLQEIAPSDYMDYRRPIEDLYDRDLNRPNYYPPIERDRDNPYDDPGYIDEYAWQIGGYTDETLPLAMAEDFYR